MQYAVWIIVDASALVDCTAFPTDEEAIAKIFARDARAPLLPQDVAIPSKKSSKLCEFSVLLLLYVALSHDDMYSSTEEAIE
jgi:hypothetical protein